MIQLAHNVNNAITPVKLVKMVPNVYHVPLQTTVLLISPLYYVIVRLVTTIHRHPNNCARNVSHLVTHVQINSHVKLAMLILTKL